jgi:hypothetical protein
MSIQHPAVQVGYSIQIQLNRASTQAAQAMLTSSLPLSACGLNSSAHEGAGAPPASGGSVMLTLNDRGSPTAGAGAAAAGAARAALPLAAPEPCC